MDQVKLECIEVAQGHSARVVTINGVTQVEIWNLNGGEFQEIVILKPYDVYCITEGLIMEGIMLQGGDCVYCIADTEANDDLLGKLTIKEIIESKTEVSKEDFINIINK